MKRKDGPKGLDRRKKIALGVIPIMALALMGGVIFLTVKKGGADQTGQMGGPGRADGFGETDNGQRKYLRGNAGRNL